tara:strand:- start:922 stop:1170 length:249 start_codon:yes stop_codon:yes gene_type:complete
MVSIVSFPGKVMVYDKGKKMKRKELIITLYEQLTQDIGDEIYHAHVWKRVRSGIYKEIFEQCSQQIPRESIRQIIGIHRKAQ